MSMRRLLLPLVLALAAGCASTPPPESLVNVGEPAPDWTWFDGERPTCFSELWEQGPLVVIWLRHYG